jgi:hypothetical protein
MVLFVPRDPCVPPQHQGLRKIWVGNRGLFRGPPALYASVPPVMALDVAVPASMLLPFCPVLSPVRGDSRVRGRLTPRGLPPTGEGQHAHCRNSQNQTLHARSFTVLVTIYKINPYHLQKFRDRITVIG